jgi:hypothetical protein
MATLLDLIIGLFPVGQSQNTHENAPNGAFPVGQIDVVSQYGIAIFLLF